MNEFEKLLNTSYSELGNIKLKKVILDGRIDEDSKIMLDTFNSNLDNTFKPSMSSSVSSSLDYSKSAKEYDYSGLINSLSKIFEREMNNSIVQWFRFMKGVEMPDFYNKVKYVDCKRTQISVVVNKDRAPIELNDESNGKLFKTSLGGILLLLQFIHNDYEYNKINDEVNLEDLTAIGRLYGEYKSFLYKLKSERNAGAHTEVIDEQSFIQFYDNYCNLVEAGWFTALMNLKERMKG